VGLKKKKKKKKAKTIKVRGRTLGEFRRKRILYGFKKNGIG